MGKYQISNFKGVFSKDLLPKIINQNESCIVNIEDYFNGNGTHWVCIYNDHNSKDVEYFDSFGLYPSDVVVDYMKTSQKGIIYNDGEIQDSNSIMCGYYCCYYIIKRFTGHKHIDILLDFDQEPTSKNEKQITKFAYNLYNDII